MTHSLFLLVCICCLAAVNGGRDEAEIVAVLKRFMGALMSGRFRDACGEVADAAPDALESILGHPGPGHTPEEIPVYELRVRRDGDRATATFSTSRPQPAAPFQMLVSETSDPGVVVEAVVHLGSDGEWHRLNPFHSDTHVVHLVFRDRWHLTAPEPVNMDDENGFQSLVGVIQHPELKDVYLKRSRDNSGDEVCISNIRLVGQRLTYHSIQEHGGSLAWIQEGTWEAAIREELKNLGVPHDPLICPKRSRPYTVNEKALTANLMRVTPEARRLVLLYDGEDRQLDFRHRGMAVVYTVAGATAIYPHEVGELRWELPD